jgi:hypothetical protein
MRRLEFDENFWVIFVNACALEMLKNVFYKQKLYEKQVFNQDSSIMESNITWTLLFVLSMFQKQQKQN